MRLIFAILIGLLFLAFPVSAGQTTQEYWVCAQPGAVEETNVYAVSNVFVDESKDHEGKEELFEELVIEQSQNQFEAGYGATCRYFGSQEKARKYLTKNIEQAISREFMIMWIDFAQRGN